MRTFLIRGLSLAMLMVSCGAQEPRAPTATMDASPISPCGEPIDCDILTLTITIDTGPAHHRAYGEVAVIFCLHEEGRLPNDSIFTDAVQQMATRSPFLFALGCADWTEGTSSATGTDDFMCRVVEELSTAIEGATVYDLRCNLTHEERI